MTERFNYQASIAQGLKALGGVYVYLGNCGLPKSLVDLAFLRASQINGCAFCIDMHTQDLLKEGMTPQNLMLVPVWRDTGSLFSRQERAALAWSEVVTLVSESHISDTDFADARAEFTDKELADLTLAIGVINTYNRLAIAFRRTPQSLDSQN